MREPESEKPLPQDRRRFFAEGLARLMGPVTDFVEKRLPTTIHATPPWLRPPGALPEAEFLATCHRCSRCVEACPAEAIKPLKISDSELHDTPYIDPNLRACVICDELACMKVCPSGALQSVDRFGIRMGLAAVDQDVCVRSQGEDCIVCVERCPLGDTAIRLGHSGQVEIIAPQGVGMGCTGCGVCQESCPTRPERAIIVSPLR